ncbi:hypothetical protein J3369_18425 [Alteromonas sp. NFXS44]|uniref:hypothetical protein n=1 Tax=Alteromonas sp. NFXS44 TaxID=2818435 RepID=UPI0032DED89F
MKSKIKLAGVALIGALSLTAQAETVTEAMQACKNEKNDLKRLICYDAVAGSMNIYAGAGKSVDDIASEQPKRQPVTTASKPQITEDDFGLEAQRLAAENLPENMSGTITDVSTSPRGDYIITLDSGMVWRQTSDDVNYKFRKGDTVMVERGALGAFYLKKSGASGRIGVRRIK